MGRLVSDFKSQAMMVNSGWSTGATARCSKAGVMSGCKASPAKHSLSWSRPMA